MKLDWARRTRKIWPLVFMILIPPVAAFGVDQARAAVFQYEGGTEKIEIDCAGKLEVTMEGLNFKCPAGSVEMPFSTITLMQFRPDVSPSVRKLKLKWTTYPNILIAGRHNRYFTVVCKKQGVTHVMVLRVDALSMRPYLAEIELKSGRRVEVMPFEDS
ncbi:MAG: hypothetical protein ACLQVM_27375 [Terriglobia bacterium]